MFRKQIGKGERDPVSVSYFVAASIVGKFIRSLFVASIKSGSSHYRFNPGPNIFLLSAPRTPN